MKQIMPALILSLWLTTTAWAANSDFDHQSFDATYETRAESSGKATARERIISDGNGLMRIEHEVGTGQPPSIELYDFRLDTHCIVDPTNHIFQKYQADMLPQGAFQKLVEGPKSIAKASPSGKPIGQKIVAGHPCHGYEATVDLAPTLGVRVPQIEQYWIGDDTHHLVRSETRSANDLHTTSRELKSWSNVIPTEANFSPPANYREIPLRNEAPPK